MTEMRKSRRSGPKRSKGVVLTTLTATAGTMALSSCGDDPWVEGQVFASVAQCTAAGVSLGECQSAWQAAQQDYLNDAPRFESVDLCQGEFGDGQCRQLSAVSPGQSGNVWVPLLGGFVIAQAMSNGGDLDIDIDGHRRRKYSPLYKGKTGSWYYGGSNYGPMTAGSNGRFGYDPAALNRPVSAPRVQTRADIASRGGFGGRASSRGGSGG